MPEFPLTTHYVPPPDDPIDLRLSAATNYAIGHVHGTPLTSFNLTQDQEEYVQQLRATVLEDVANEILYEIHDRGWNK